MRSSEFGGNKDDGEESSSSSSGSGWETPRQLDMSNGGEHVVELRPRFEPLTLPAPLLKELLRGEPARSETPEATADHVREHEIATGESGHKEDDEDDDEEEDASTSTAAPVRPAAPVAQSSVVEQLIQEMDTQTAAENSGEPVEIDLHEPVALPPAATFEGAPPAPPAPAEYQPPVQAPQSAYRPATPPPTFRGAGGPPNPPIPPAENAAFYYPESVEPASATPAEWGGPSPAFEPQRQFESGMYAPAFAPAERGLQEAIDRASGFAEQNGVRRGLVAGFIVGIVTASWIAGRRANRVAQETAKVNLQNERRIGQLETAEEAMRQRMQTQNRVIEQFQYNQPPAPAGSPFERPSSPNTAAERFDRPMPQPNPNVAPQQAPEQAPLAAQVEQVLTAPNGEQQIVLQPGQRLERQGWYSVVKNGNEVVSDAINYGEAMREEQRREQAPPASQDQGNSNDNQGQDGGVPAGAFFGATGVSSLITSGQINASHQLAMGQRADIDHRLGVSRNPVAVAFSSPWLWAGIVVLLVAFFVAALV